jgi:hypothetical protein
MRVNRLVFQSGGYTLRGKTLELTGVKPAIQLNSLGRVIFALPVQLADGKALPPGTYTASSRPDLIAGPGTLTVENPR